MLKLTPDTSTLSKIRQIYLDSIKETLQQTINSEIVDLHKVESSLRKQKEKLSKKYKRFIFADLTLTQHNVHGRIFVQMLPDEKLLEMVQTVH